MKRFLHIIFLTIATLMLLSVTVAAETTVYCASPTGEIAVHISPDKDSFVLDNVLSCSKMSLIKKHGIWGLVNISGKTGWVNLSFTREDYNEAAETTGYGSEKIVQIKQSVQKVSLYSLPSDEKQSGSNEKYSVPAGTVLEIVRETESGWGLVPMKDDYAWMKMENVEIYKGKDTIEKNTGIYYVYTKAKSRRGADLYSQNGGGIILKVIPNCIKLTVRESREKYLYTSYDGINGWVKISDVTISQEDARTNVGIKEYEEYITTTSSGIYNIPSQQKIDGAVVLGSISEQKRVFVQRVTYDGWLLINHDGIVGWIPPESAMKDLSQKENLAEIFEEFTFGYTASERNDGVRLYASPGAKDYVLTVPECVRMETIAKEGDFLFVRCDYASGWINEDSLKKDLEEAISQNLMEDKQVYYIKAKTSVMSLPATDASFGSTQIATAEKGEKVNVLKIVTGGKTKWAYISADGQNGWINLANARKEVSLMVKTGITGVVIILIGTIFFLILFSKKNKKKGTDTNGKENLQD